MTDKLKARAKFQRAWYVWMMTKNRNHIKQSTKDQLEIQMEDAVVWYAAEIVEGRGDDDD